TDRPAYRPGDTVNLRAIVRRAHQGAYVCEKGEPWVLSVLSSRGDELLRKEVAVDDFGTAAGSVALDGNAPTGQYRVALASAREKALSFQGTFLVQIYRREKVRLEVVFDRPVFMRGEPLVGRVRARYA